ncbi:cryptochrome/photolyase family protein [Chiayiivirga flava]|uniref:Deoxyribodipyrimidine photolyase-related protein n=1 Tax=Chiayiivirga flava TaxID=659595 RepID=A0A7W8D7V9_9GAMM|nr:cryptochrome/photolyase family protein [Chiayiivirga flava]MBB5209549.1 deoxyribodipyrimidine photolyase-related protein [Chiayiivirga flava]
MRNLVVVLGDQLDGDSAALAGFDPARDAVWMCEAPAEARYAWSHKARIVTFLSAMRHFRDVLRARGFDVLYRATGEHPHATLADALQAQLQASRPQRVVAVQPGEWRLADDLRRVCEATGTPLVQREDTHFLCRSDDFAQWMARRTQPRMEHFYRWMRQRSGILMRDDAPEGGAWNYDHDNRDSFDARGPGLLPAPRAFAPDAITREVIALVHARYADHPGTLDAFDWPVTRNDALLALDDFVVHRLPLFGRYQDAMWDSEPWLYHARLSAAMNLKLLHPREVVDAAVAAYADGAAPLAAVEGFVRQILGWREYVRGLYWHRMPQYLDDNALDAQQPLPAFYWTGDTTMRCLAVTIADTLRHGYAHHIQRLMVTGLFALLLGVRPREVHGWYLAVYVDAVEWVELPNTIGMSQFADGGVMGSKPYIASGKYIERMSNYCDGCRFDPAVATGADACPFTTLYWDFLDRHRRRFGAHPRLKLQVANLLRKSGDERAAIAEQARLIRASLTPSPDR